MSVQKRIQTYVMRITEPQVEGLRHRSEAYLAQAGRATHCVRPYRLGKSSREMDVGVHANEKLSIKRKGRKQIAKLSTLQNEMLLGVMTSGQVCRSKS